MRANNFESIFRAKINATSERAREAKRDLGWQQFWSISWAKISAITERAREAKTALG